MGDSGVDANGEGRWWRSDAPDQVIPAIARAIDTEASFSTRMRHCISLFEGRPFGGLGPQEYAARTPGTHPVGWEVAEWDGAPQTTTNVVRRIVNALMAEIAQSRPRPMFLTDGGSYVLQEQAKKLTRFTIGCFAESKVDEVMKACAQDAMVCGKGVARIFEEDGRMRVERVPPGYFLVDNADAINGQPRSVYQRMYVDRGRLLALHPEHEDAILAARRSEDPLGVGFSKSTSDQVEVLEAWHLPSRAKNERTGKEASDDGRHVVVIAGATLVDEKWESARFPFAFYAWQRPMFGFWPQGIAEILTPIQMKLVDLEDRIDSALDQSALRIFVPLGAPLTAEHMQSVDGTIIRFDPQAGPPVFNAAATVPPELYAERDRLKGQAFEETGVSEMAATAEKPAGVESGEGLRTLIDHQSKRFLDPEQAYEQFAVDIAEAMVDLIQQLAENDSSYEVVFQDEEGIERIAWKDIDLSRDAYRISVPPVSALPKDPAGRLAALQGYVESGMADKMGWTANTIRSLSNFPDLSAVQPTTPEDSAKADVSAMLRKGKYIPPEEFQDLKVCVRVAQDALLDLRRKDAPEEKLQLLRDYIADAQHLDAQAQQASAPPAPPAPPPGAPALPPPPGGSLPAAGALPPAPAANAA